MPETTCVAITTPSARTSHRTISLPNGEFIPPATLPRRNPRATKISFPQGNPQEERRTSNLVKSRIAY
jgi:hypothetical protein